jgi:hypothetical protein
MQSLCKLAGAQSIECCGLVRPRSDDFTSASLLMKLKPGDEVVNPRVVSVGKGTDHPSNVISFV